MPSSWVRRSLHSRLAAPHGAGGATQSLEHASHSATAYTKKRSTSRDGDQDGPALGALCGRGAGSLSDAARLPTTCWQCAAHRMQASSAPDAAAGGSGSGAAAAAATTAGGQKQQQRAGAWFRCVAPAAMQPGMTACSCNPWNGWLLLGCMAGPHCRSSSSAGKQPPAPSGGGPDGASLLANLGLWALWVGLGAYAFLVAPNQTPLRDAYFLEKLVGLVSELFL